jgi:hypothetical protein
MFKTIAAGRVSVEVPKTAGGATRVIEGIILREVGIRKVLLSCGGEQRRDRYDDAVRVGIGVQQCGIKGTRGEEGVHTTQEKP